MTTSAVSLFGNSSKSIWFNGCLKPFIIIGFAKEKIKRDWDNLDRKELWQDWEQLSLFDKDAHGHGKRRKCWETKTRVWFDEAILGRTEKYDDGFHVL